MSRQTRCRGVYVLGGIPVSGHPHCRILQWRCEIPSAHKPCPLQQPTRLERPPADARASKEEWTAKEPWPTNRNGALEQTSATSGDERDQRATSRMWHGLSRNRLWRLVGRGTCRWLYFLPVAYLGSFVDGRPSMALVVCRWRLSVPGPVTSFLRRAPRCTWRVRCRICLPLPRLLLPPLLLPPLLLPLFPPLRCRPSHGSHRQPRSRQRPSPIPVPLPP